MCIWHSLVGRDHYMECDHPMIGSQVFQTYCVALTPVNYLIRTSVF